MRTFLLSFITYFTICFAFFLIFSSIVKKNNLKGTIIIALLIIIGISIRYSLRRDIIDYKYLSANKTLIGQYNSATEFKVYPYSFEGRKCQLYNVDVSMDSLSQSLVMKEFKRLTRNKRVKMQFPGNTKPNTEVWSVILYKDSVNINLLLSDIKQKGADMNTINKPVKTIKSSQRGTKTVSTKIFSRDRKELLPLWIYLLIGLFGATSLGMVINKRPAGCMVFPFLIGLLLLEFYLGVKNQLPLWKPVLTSIWIILMGGMGAKSNKQFLENHPNYK